DLESVYDADWFAVEVEEGQGYAFHMKGAHDQDETYGTLEDPYLILVDENGETLREDDDGGDPNDALISYTPENDTTLYLQAESYDNAYSGTYTVAVEETEPDDCPADRDTDCSIDEEGTSLSEKPEIETEGDVDWFEVTKNPRSDESFQFDLEGAPTNEGELDNPKVALYDGNDNKLAEDDDGGSGNNARLTYTPQDTSKTFYIAAESAEYNDTGTYTPSLTIYPDDCPDHPSDVCSVGIDESKTIKSIEKAADTDWLEVAKMNADESYLLDLKGSDSGDEGKELPDPLLRVYDGEGNELAVDDDGNDPDAQLLFTPPEDGTYYAAAESSPDDPDGKGDYTLEVTDYSDEDDCAGSTSTDCDVDSSNDPDNPKKGTIEVSGDEDWYQLAEGDVNTGATYLFELSGSSELENPRLRILDENGEELRSSGVDKDGDSTSAQLAFTIPDNSTDSEYYVAAESGTDGDTGDFDLSMQDISTEDDYGDCSDCSPGAVAEDGSDSGTLEYPGDRDWFGVDLEADSSYTFTLEGDTLDTPYLRLRDADGNVIDSDSGSDTEAAEVTFLSGSDQEVYVEAASLDDEGAGTYTVSAALNYSGGDDDGGDGGTSDGDSAGGGCALSAEPQPLDPTLPLLTALGLAYLLGRGRARA
ncbi:MAG: JDVT-CTERM domain-containing protein, partial [Thiohalorhabdus sp.]